MKQEDIESYETGEHCFGPILKVNNKNYDDYSKEEITELINDTLENDINSENFRQEAFKLALEYLQFELVENDYHTCEQCGNPNDYYRFIKT